MFQKESVANYLKYFLNHVDNLELELEFLLKQNSTNTQLIGEIATEETVIKQEKYFFFSFMFGLFLSAIMVFINNSLKAIKQHV